MRLNQVQSGTLLCYQMFLGLFFHKLFTIMCPYLIFLCCALYLA